MKSGTINSGLLSFSLQVDNIFCKVYNRHTSCYISAILFVLFWLATIERNTIQLFSLILVCYMQLQGKLQHLSVQTRQNYYIWSKCEQHDLVQHVYMKPAQAVEAKSQTRQYTWRKTILYWRCMLVGHHQCLAQEHCSCSESMPCSDNHLGPY